MKRRTFLKGLLATATLPAVAKATSKPEIDVDAILEARRMMDAAEVPELYVFGERSILVEGIDVNGEKVIETHVLQGTTPIETKALFKEIPKITIQNDAPKTKVFGKFNIELKA